jgi:dTDP-4-dehydrorhamnose reductase
MGVQNVKRACIKYNCFLLQISTEYVFDGDRGQYSEKDLPNPITRYGWSKVIGEEVLYDMKQSLILRLSFVDPDDLKFPKALIDQYSSRDLIESTCADIKLLLMAINRGIKIPRLLHIGAQRRSQYDFYKTFKSAIEKKSLKEIPFRLPVDVSFDLSLWKKIKAEILNKCNKLSLKEDGQ